MLRLVLAADSDVLLEVDDSGNVRIAEVDCKIEEVGTNEQKYGK